MAIWTGDNDALDPYASTTRPRVTRDELDARAKQATEAGRAWDRAFVQQCPLPEPFADRCRTCRWPEALVAGECRRCAMVRGYEAPLGPVLAVSA
jgi:hypothetical protein